MEDLIININFDGIRKEMKNQELQVIVHVQVQIVPFNFLHMDSRWNAAVSLSELNKLRLPCSRVVKSLK